MEHGMALLARGETHDGREGRRGRLVKGKKGRLLLFQVPRVEGNPIWSCDTDQTASHDGRSSSGASGAFWTWDRPTSSGLRLLWALSIPL